MTVVASVAYETRFGDGWIAYSGDELYALGLPRVANPHQPGASPPRIATDMAERLAEYWEGGELPAVTDDALTAACRTDLDRLIYQRVIAIPAGTTLTYGAVADGVGRPRAARAVGAAMAANRFAPLIPCHRVVGTDGSLRGYAGGVDMKRYLLDIEAANSG